VVRRVSHAAAAALSALVSINLSPVRGAIRQDPHAATQNKQELSSLDVIVTEPSGAVLANAQVTLTGPNGQQIKLLTDSAGRAHFSGLSFGNYTLVVSARLFQEVHKTATVQKGTTSLAVTLPEARQEHICPAVEQVPIIETVLDSVLSPYKILPLKKDRKKR
jgi:hypothetical protein